MEIALDSQRRFKYEKLKLALALVILKNKPYDFTLEEYLDFVRVNGEYWKDLVKHQQFCSELEWQDRLADLRVESARFVATQWQKKALKANQELVGLQVATIPLGGGPQAGIASTEGVLVALLKQCASDLTSSNLSGLRGALSELQRIVQMTPFEVLVRVETLFGDFLAGVLRETLNQQLADERMAISAMSTANRGDQLVELVYMSVGIEKFASVSLKVSTMLLLERLEIDQTVAYKENTAFLVFLLERICLSLKPNMKFSEHVKGIIDRPSFQVDSSALVLEQLFEGPDHEWSHKMTDMLLVKFFQVRSQLELCFKSRLY